MRHCFHPEQETGGRRLACLLPQLLLVLVGPVKMKTPHEAYRKYLRRYNHTL